MDYPYGGIRWESDTLPTDFRFTGEKWEAALGLCHMGARWIDPSLGRWVSPDSIVPDPANPQSLNRFSFVLGNPLKYRDPTGHMESTGNDKEGTPPPLPDWLVELLSDPSFLDWLTQQAGNWVWNNVPSAVGLYGDFTGSLGVFFEGELGNQFSLMFNWRSGELTLFAGPGAGAYAGTPRGGSLGVSGGPICAW